jgi:adenylate kinase
MNIVVLGPPASGKGTQSKRLAAALSVPHLSVGELLRTCAETDAAIEALLRVGALVDDSVTLRLLAARLAQPDCASGYILDGFPRRVSQALALFTLPRVPRKVVVLEAPKELLRQRMHERTLKEGRDDDSDEVFEERLRLYDSEELGILAILSAELSARGGAVHKVDAAGSIAEVDSRIRAALGII